MIAYSAVQCYTAKAWNTVILFKSQKLLTALTQVLRIVLKLAISNIHPNNSLFYDLNHINWLIDNFPVF